MQGIHVTCIFIPYIWLSFEWNLIRPGGLAHGIVTKTVNKTLPGVVGVKEVEGGRVWVMGLGVVGVKGWVVGGGVKVVEVVGVKEWWVVGSRVGVHGVNRWMVGV